ncbi:hypothetical protein EV700_0393 [Fluviicoccus keumensis]|uniref:HD domain-containing protein n=1 Tax=Fluviicoccus keumensis TaxID=1435465 RepID=A0A4Q7ZBD1_9GAMM|nr:phosphohydrolase [Fluviicoccus keumensis]RZU47431.1 hypothetical protein EV700_0393 [Fluviicoccus keumensis]
MSTPDIITFHPRLDTLLEEWHDALGQDFTAYHNHCYRVLNYFAVLSNADDETTLDKAAVALAFHDIGIWSHGTLDYLEPSSLLAEAWLLDHGLDDWVPDITAMISDHHKVTACADNPIAETFRQADWADVTQGLRRFSLPLGFAVRVMRTFPNAGFHQFLMRQSVQQALKHPLNPLPMFRW